MRKGCAGVATGVGCMSDPAVWLTARLDEIEAAANAAAHEAPSPWRRVGGLVEHSGAADYQKDQGLWDSEGCRDGRLCMTDAVAEYVALHDPASVLLLVAALRKLLELHREWVTYIPQGVCDTCCPEGSTRPVGWPCPTVRVLAEGYGWVEE
jgi:hypothetical protein